MTFISGLCYWRVPRTLVKRALRHDWRGWVNTNVNVPIDDLLCKHSTVDYFPFPSLWLQHSWSEHTCFIYVLYIILLWIPTGIKLSLFILTPTFIWELWEHIMASWLKEIWGNQSENWGNQIQWNQKHPSLDVVPEGQRRSTKRYFT